MGCRKKWTKLTSEEQDAIVRDYKPGMLLTELGAKHDTSYHVVRNLLVRRIGFSKRPLGRPRVCKIDESVFDVLGEHAAYWVGFLMADGCVHSNKVVINLASKDKDHLYRFREFLGSTHAISDDTLSTMGFGSGTFNRFTFRSTAITNRLKELGVQPRKTQTAEAPPQLAYDRDFWRGMVDGDGCLGLHSKRRMSPRIRLKGTRRITEQFLDFAKSIHPVWAKPRQAPGCFEVSISDRPAFAVISALYADCCVALERKLEIARGILATNFGWKKRLAIMKRE